MWKGWLTRCGGGLPRITRRCKSISRVCCSRMATPYRWRAPRQKQAPRSRVRIFPQRLRAGSVSGMSNGFAAQQAPTPAPLPRLGPNPAVVAGVGTAALAGVLVTVFALGHHRGGYTMLDAGSQIDMVLQSPLNLDGDQVAAALASVHGRRGNSREAG